MYGIKLIIRLMNSLTKLPFCVNSDQLHYQCQREDNKVEPACDSWTCHYYSFFSIQWVSEASYHMNTMEICVNICDDLFSHFSLVSPNRFYINSAKCTFLIMLCGEKIRWDSSINSYHSIYSFPQHHRYISYQIGLMLSCLVFFHLVCVIWRSVIVVSWTLYNRWMEDQHSSESVIHCSVEFKLMNRGIEFLFPRFSTLKTIVVGVSFPNYTM